MCVSLYVLPKCQRKLTWEPYVFKKVPVVPSDPHGAYLIIFYLKDGSTGSHQIIVIVTSTPSPPVHFLNLALYIMVLPETGRYHIVNVAEKERLAAMSEGGHQSSPVVGQRDNAAVYQKWNVTVLSNGNRYIQNYGYIHLWAVYDIPDENTASVMVATKPEQWILKEAEGGGILIAPLGKPEMFWHLENDVEGTPVKLKTGQNNTQNQWTFHPTVV